MAVWTNNRGPEFARLHAKVLSHLEAWIKLAGHPARKAQIISRIPHHNIDILWRHVSEALRLASVYGDVDPGPDNAVCLLEARIYKMFR